MYRSLHSTSRRGKSKRVVNFIFFLEQGNVFGSFAVSEKFCLGKKKTKQMITTIKGGDGAMIEKCWSAAAALIVFEVAGRSYNGQATWHTLLNTSLQKHEPLGSCFTCAGRWTCLCKSGKSDLKILYILGKNSNSADSLRINSGVSDHKPSFSTLGS